MAALGKERYLFVKSAGTFVAEWPQLLHCSCGGLGNYGESAQAVAGAAQAVFDPTPDIKVRKGL